MVAISDHSCILYIVQKKTCKTLSMQDPKHANYLIYVDDVKLLSQVSGLNQMMVFQMNL